MVLPVAGSGVSIQTPAADSTHFPPMSIRRGWARNDSTAGRMVGVVMGLRLLQVDNLLSLRLIEIRIAAALGGRTGKADALPDRRVAQVEGGHVHPQLLEE